MRLETRYNAADFQNRGADWAEVVIDTDDGWAFELIRFRAVAVEEKYEVEHSIYQACDGWVWSSGDALWSVSKFHEFLETADRVVRSINGKMRRRDVLAAIADEWETVLLFS